MGAPTRCHSASLSRCSALRTRLASRGRGAGAAHAAGQHRRPLQPGAASHGKEHIEGHYARVAMEHSQGAGRPVFKWDRPLSAEETAGAAESAAVQVSQSSQGCACVVS